MGAPRKPTNVLALTGAFKHDPARGRARADEPTPAAPISAEPPVTLSEIESICWRELVARCAPGVLADTDEHLVEFTAKLLAAIRYGEAIELTKAGPLLVKSLGLMGMTPADRSRVSAAGAAREPSPYDEFDNGTNR